MSWYSRILSALQINKVSFFLGIFLLIFSLFLSSLEPRIFQLAVDYVIKKEQLGHHVSNDPISIFLQDLLRIDNDPENGLMTIALSFLFITLIKGGGFFLSTYFNIRVTEHSIANLRSELFCRLQYLPISYFDRNTKGQILQRLSGDINTLKSFHQVQLYQVFRLGAILVFTFIMMLTINVNYTLFSVILLPLVPVIGFIGYIKGKRNFIEYQQSLDHFSNGVKTNLDFIRYIIANKTDEQEINRLDELSDIQKEAEKKFNRFKVKYWIYLEIIVDLQIIISLTVGGWHVFIGWISIGEFTSLFFYAMMICWPLKLLGNILSEFAKVRVSANRILQILNYEREVTQKVEPTTPVFRPNRIRFENVQFIYSARPNENLLFEDLSFSIHPGENLALIGPVGSGKSTLLKLILGIYAPQEGTIFVNDYPLDQLDLTILRENIGWASQNHFLYSRSLIENITLSRDLAPRQIEQAIADAELTSLKHQLPDGLNTIIGQKGFTLSGGQKQRVAIARALCADPSILLLDNIEASLDAKTGDKVLRNIFERYKDKTILIISHQIKTIEMCDRVITLCNGTISQTGAPEKLALIPGYYKDIWDQNIINHAPSITDDKKYKKTNKIS